MQTPVRLSNYCLPEADSEYLRGRRWKNKKGTSCRKGHPRGNFVIIDLPYLPTVTNLSWPLDTLDLEGKISVWPILPPQAYSFFPRCLYPLTRQYFEKLNWLWFQPMLEQYKFIRISNGCYLIVIKVAFQGLVNKIFSVDWTVDGSIVRLWNSS